MDELVIYGAGGLGREVLWQVSESERLRQRFLLLGFIDDNQKLKNATVNGYPVVGDESWLLNCERRIAVVICVGNADAREAIVERLRRNRHIYFPVIIAPDVRFSDTVEFGEGCIICLSSILTVNIKLGQFVLVSSNCVIGHDSVLDDYATLYPNVKVSGNIHIGGNCEIGTGTAIIQGKTIGSHSIIGAGSAVVRDIPDHCTAVGTPARPIKFR